MNGAGCLPLQEDAATAANLLPPDEIFGMTWTEIFVLRDQMAHKYYWKFRQRIPLEEFLSAGNLAIAIAQRDFPQAKSGASFRAYLGRTLIHRFLECWDEEKKKVQRGTLHGFPISAMPSYVPYECRQDAAHLLQRLATLSTARNRAMLLAWLSGESDTAIGQRFGLHKTNVSRAIRMLLHDLQAWALRGDTSPQPIRRRVTSLTPQDRHTIRRLAQEGMSRAALKRRFGCARTVITQLLHKGEEE